MPLEDEYSKYKDLLRKELDFKVFMESTLIYRELQGTAIKEIKNTLTEIKDTLSVLPCESRKSWYNSMNKQVGFMWGVLAILLVASLAVAKTSNDERTDVMRTMERMKIVIQQEESKK
jgi:hypothetical protein